MPKPVVEPLKAAAINPDRREPFGAGVVFVLLPSVVLKRGWEIP